MSLTNPLPPPIVSSLEPIMAAAGSENEKFVQKPLGSSIAGDSNSPDVVLVDYEENDPENPLNWSPMHKWLIVIAISWMGFVR